jgi:hypothetical protein
VVLTDCIMFYNIFSHAQCRTLGPSRCRKPQRGTSVATVLVVKEA